MKCEKRKSEWKNKVLVQDIEEMMQLCLLEIKTLCYPVSFCGKFYNLHCPNFHIETQILNFNYNITQTHPPHNE